MAKGALCSSTENCPYSESVASNEPEQVVTVTACTEHGGAFKWWLSCFRRTVGGACSSL